MSITTDTPASEGAGSRNAVKETDFKLDFSQVEIGTYKGIPLPYFNEPLEIHVPKVMNLSLRDTDIVLLTYPKSGTHWVWRVLDMLAMGSAVYSDRHLDMFMLDFAPIVDIVNTSTDVRRILQSHYPSDFLPTQLKDGRVKVVHVYRHPKATLVSRMYFIRNRGLNPDLTLEELEDKANANTIPYKNQFYYFDKLMEYERDNPNVDIFHLAYEDMKKDTVGCIKKLAAHVNVDASDELCTSIGKAVSLSTQKEKEEVLSDTQKSVQIYRKGEVDDWKNYFTVAQSERMDKVLADRAASCQFSRRYCPTVTTDQGHVYRLASSS